MRQTYGEVTILRGPSHSGKSTIAQFMVADYPDKAMIVSRDIIRQSFGLVGKGVLTTAQERQVTEIEMDQLRRGIVKGKHVIVDDTNIDPRVIGKIIDECHLHGVEPTIQEVDTPLEVCLERAEKDGTVPLDVVRKQHARGFPEPQIRVPLIETIAPNLSFPPPTAFIFDIDGTLAHYNPKLRDVYDGSKVYLDELDQAVAYLADQIWYGKEGNCVLVVSGRDSKYREVTKQWLDKHYIPYDRLYMRPEGDTRHDAAVKYEIAQNIVRDFDVQGVVDDRSRVCRMWRTAGFQTYQVGDHFECDF